MASGTRGNDRLWTFLAGIVTGAAGLVLAKALFPGRGFDPWLVGRPDDDSAIPPVVVVPGILGSELTLPDGTGVWLNLGNAFGSHDLRLPLSLPLTTSRDELVAGGLLGVDAVLPRLFGFTEYADLLNLLQAAGFERDGQPGRPTHHVFTYDWRRDLVESARALHDVLERRAAGDPALRFNVIGHSMGGLVARYYLRYGTAELAEDMPVTWAGAARIRNLVLVAVPNAGSIPALDAVLNGSRVGLSTTTLSAQVIARMPAIYQLLPPRGSAALVDARGEPLADDLHDPATWERRKWGPYGPSDKADRDAERAFLASALARARLFHAALARRPDSPCPSRVLVLGGDCLPTLARAIVDDRPGVPPRFEAWSREEARLLFEAGDGRVTRASALASHLPGAGENDFASGLPEVAHAVFGAADHHGIYAEPTFQSILLRLLRPRGSRRRFDPPEP